MTAIDGTHAARVREYYEATTEQGYLRSWAGDALGFHFGLSDDESTSHDDSLLEANRVVAERAVVGGGTRVLDAGCGVGGSSIWLAERHGADVVGVTIDPNQVTMANRFAEARGVAGRTRFVCADLQRDEIPGRPFDVVWHIESFCHLDDPEGYLRRAWALLAPGGRLVSLDLHRGDEAGTGHCRAMSDGWLLPRLATLEQMGDMLEHAGFVDVESEDLTHRTLRSASRLLAMASHRLLMLEMKRSMLGEEDPVYEGHTRAAIGAAKGLAGGGVRYGLVSARRPPPDARGTSSAQLR